MFCIVVDSHFKNSEVAKRIVEYLKVSLMGTQTWLIVEQELG